MEHVPVLEQSLLGDVRLLEVNAQFQVLEHDRFEYTLAPVVCPFLVPEHLVEGVEGPAGAADLQELCTGQEQTASLVQVLTINIGRGCIADVGIYHWPPAAGPHLPLARFNAFSGLWLYLDIISVEAHQLTRDTGPETKLAAIYGRGEEKNVA